MDILLAHPIPVAGLLLLAFAMYIAEIAVKRRCRDRKRLRTVLITVFTVIALLANTALIILTLSWGGSTELVLALMLLSLLGALI